MYLKINYICKINIKYIIFTQLTIYWRDKMVELPKAPLKRLFKEAGADRVSDKAVNALHDFIIDEASVLAHNSVQLSCYNNRKTVQLKDVEAVLNLE